MKVKLYLLPRETRRGVHFQTSYMWNYPYLWRVTVSPWDDGFGLAPIAVIVGGWLEASIDPIGSKWKETKPRINKMAKCLLFNFIHDSMICASPNKFEYEISNFMLLFIVFEFSGYFLMPTTGDIFWLIQKETLIIIIKDEFYFMFWLPAWS